MFLQSSKIVYVLLAKPSGMMFLPSFPHFLSYCCSFHRVFLQNLQIILLPSDKFSQIYSRLILMYFFRSRSFLGQFVVHEVPYEREHQFWEDTDDTESDALLLSKVYRYGLSDWRLQQCDKKIMLCHSNDQ
ncbi:hypothetical protein WN944_000933 [Citrus x changshan-huyou]|uniref:Uncharacterized protein n=1 Tax=Citrus x changshan-huyou TaxID=2935761 RepID=A0AAP0MDT3_9ROSI